MPAQSLRISTWLVCALLCACGGGSSGGGEPPVPTGPPGTLDASFGTGGTVVTTGANPLHANAMALQPDAKIVVVGSSGVDAAKTFYVLRYNSDGSLDSSFGSGGSVTTAFDLVAGSEARSVALQPDGKIVVVGGSAGACALARYNADGTLDPTFGTGGTELSRAANDDVTCTGVALQPDGRIVTAVQHAPVSSIIGAYQRAGSLMRFDANGSRDASFAKGGEAVLSCGVGTCQPTGVAIQQTGEIVVSGMGWIALPFGGSTLVFLARFDSRGILDARFGPGIYPYLSSGYGTVDYASFNCLPTGLAVQPDGRYVVFGGTFELFSDLEACFVLDRVTADGSRDAGFGNDGRAAHPSAGGVNALYAFGVQTDGKIVAVGANVQFTPAFQPIQSAGLARYDGKGAFDASFGSGGTALLPISGQSSASGVAIVSDGRIVVAGTVTATSSQPAIFVARYFGNAP